MRSGQGGERGAGQALQGLGVTAVRISDPRKALPLGRVVRERVV